MEAIRKFTLNISVAAILIMAATEILRVNLLIASIVFSKN